MRERDDPQTSSVPLQRQVAAAKRTWWVAFVNELVRAIDKSTSTGPSLKFSSADDATVTVLHGAGQLTVRLVADAVLLETRTDKSSAHQDAPIKFGQDRHGNLVATLHGEPMASSTAAVRYVLDACSPRSTLRRSGDVDRSESSRLLARRRSTEAPPNGVQ